MLTTVKAGPYTIRGVSVGGVYTSLHVPELDCLFDAGIVARSMAGATNILLSHGHTDHLGALPALLGVRGLLRLERPRLFAPTRLIPALRATLGELSKVQRYSLDAELIGAEAGEEHALGRDLTVRVFRTHHTVPSVGYQLFRRVQKLKPEYVGLAGTEIKRRREAGDDLFVAKEHLE